MLLTKHGMISVERLVGIASKKYDAVIKQTNSFAKVLDSARIMRHHHDGFAIRSELRHPLSAFILKSLVAYSEYFVHQKHVRL